MCKVSAKSERVTWGPLAGVGMNDPEAAVLGRAMTTSSRSQT